MDKTWEYTEDWPKLQVITLSQGEVLDIDQLQFSFDLLVVVQNKR
jgi:hypothetical protein